MKAKKILFSLTLGTFFSCAPLAISCTKNTLNITIREPWSYNHDTNFITQIVNEYNNLINSENLNLEPIKESNANYVGENHNTYLDLIKKSVDVSYMTTENYYQHKEDVNPIIQTMTYAFKFDKESNQYYSDGSSTDPLVKIAKEAETYFATKPYGTWNDDEYEWNGIKYNYFYDENKKLVDFYRGCVIIWGDEQTLKGIKDAWDSKDWNAFRNYGIMFGKETSASKYKLQEALFKKHFNNFKSFRADQLNNATKYIQGKAKDLSKGSNAKYHIVFDELGSFAYTHNSKNGVKNNYYTCTNPNHKIEFLTATEPMKFDLFVVNKSMELAKQKLISKAIYNVWINNKDEYGPLVGYNGYRRINNLNEEVIVPYEKLFK